MNHGTICCNRDRCESFSGYMERGEGEEIGYLDCIDLVPDWAYIDDYYRLDSSYKSKLVKS